MRYGSCEVEMAAGPFWHKDPRLVLTGCLLDLNKLQIG